MERKEAIDKGYLENKKIILMPSPREGKMISDPKHVAFFKMDGVSTIFCLPRNNRGDLVKVFNNDEEKKFFENELGLDLNVSRPGNYFETMTVTVVKDSALMYKGEPYDLSDPMDNLRWRILKNAPTVAKDWESRMDEVPFEWALVDSASLNQEAEVEFDSQSEFWMQIGKVSDEASKLRTTLTVYFRSINSTKKVSATTGKTALMKEINEIAANKVSRENFLDILGGRLFQSKALILRAIESGAIVKQGDDIYVFAGDEVTHTFNEMAEKLEELKEDQDDIYFKIVAQIEKANKE